MSTSDPCTTPVTNLQDLANVGPAIERDLRKLGIQRPEQLVGQDAFELYERLREETGEPQDPCVLDTFMAAIDQASGASPRPWHHYTPDRKVLVFLREIGVWSVRHNSNADLLPHLIGTRDLLREWGAKRALIDAGVCHSLYGTEYFHTTTLPETRRDEVRAVIGEEAETLVWLWCFGRRTSLEDSLEGRTQPRMRELRTREWLPLEERQLDDLMTLWIADTIEQLPRVPEREVDTARELMRWRSRALPGARAALEETVEQWAHAC